MTFIIAEIGVNHQGDIKFAQDLVDAAVYAGADAVKFQMFDAELLEPPGERRDMLKRLEFGFDEFKHIRDYCQDKKIEFMCTPFDTNSLWVLRTLGIKRIKIASGHLTDMKLLQAAEESQLPVILSTGMGNKTDISLALWKLKYSPNITLLHCNSAYPTPYEDVNLRAMKTLRDAFGCPVGFSDHTLGISAPFAAVALGAAVIEKHLTLDRNMRGPDHRMSTQPNEFKRMVDGIREVELALGDGVKAPRESEKQTQQIIKERVEWSKARS